MIPEKCTPLLSIILPVYNLEQYMPTTLVNIAYEQFSDNSNHLWEMIIINDGSTDNSGNIIQDFINSYSYQNIHIIHTAKSGVSHARNIGLANARGEYVYFMDGDDLLKKRSLQNLCQIINELKPEILQFGYEAITSEQYPNIATDIPEATQCSFLTTDTKYYCEETVGLTKPKSQWSVWQHIFKRSFLKRNNLLFDETLTIGEDACFLWSALSVTSIITIVPSSIYLYNIRPDSTFHCNISKTQLNERIKFISKFNSLKSVLEACGFGQKTLFGISCNIRVSARDVVFKGLLYNDISYINIIRILKQLKYAGVCGTGLAQDKDRVYSLTFRQNIRRLLIAYIIIPLIKL